MKSILRLEEFALFAFSIVLFAELGVSWWLYPALLLAPDLSMVGYLAGPAVGAMLYNLFHHKGVAVLLFSIGWLLSIQWLAVAGVILFGHASLDRAVGYGLKFSDSFKHTHLGDIG